MSQILSRSVLSSFPPLETMNTILSRVLDGTGEVLHMVGYIVLEDPLSAAKTISAAGGGSIVWKSGTTTFANAGTTFEVGIQDVSTSTAISQGDGTFDVKASFAGGGGGVTSGAVQTSVMTSGSKSLSNGQLISVSFLATSIAGVDSIGVNICGEYVTPSGLPCVTDNTTGAIAAVSTGEPLCYIVFDDGTIGWFYGCSFVHTISTIAFNSGSATADEYAHILYPPCAFKVTGMWIYSNLASSSADIEVILYSDALVAPVAERTIVIDATQIGATSAYRGLRINLVTPYLMQPNMYYAMSIRPTTANNVTLTYFDTTTLGKKTGVASDYCHAGRRLDNTGPFSDYNGGTAKTRLFWMSLLGSYVGQDTHFAHSQIGI